MTFNEFAWRHHCWLKLEYLKFFRNSIIILLLILLYYYTYRMKRGNYRLVRISPPTVAKIFRIVTFFGPSVFA